MFADDVALVARTADGLRRVFHHFYQFCVREHLTISTRKTKAVIADSAWEGALFSIDGFDFEVVPHFKYLGMPLDAGGGGEIMV